MHNFLVITFEIIFAIFFVVLIWNYVQALAIVKEKYPDYTGHDLFGEMPNPKKSKKEEKLFELTEDDIM